MVAVLAIDSGGSKCAALLVRSDGLFLGCGECDVSDSESGRAWGGSGRSPESVAHACRMALDGVRCDVLHVANPRGETSLFSEYAAEVIYLSVSEEDAAYALIGVKEGLVVLAGTGAFVHGRTCDGRSVHLDSLGPLVGDYGSAYHIGYLGLRAAARALWRPRHSTSLSEIMRRTCGSGPDEPSGFCLVRFAGGTPDRAEVAALARIVDDGANGGDAISIRILHEAAEAIGETVRDVVDSLAMYDREYPMIGTGSVATNSRIYWSHLCEYVAGFAPRLTPVLPSAPQVVGVALVALELLGTPVDEDLRQSLTAAYRAACAARKVVSQ